MTVDTGNGTMTFEIAIPTEAKLVLQKEPDHQRNYPNPGYGEAMPTNYQPPQNYGGYGGGPPPYGGQQVAMVAQSVSDAGVSSFVLAFKGGAEYLDL